MYAEQDRHAPRLRWIRAGLIVLAATMLGTGSWAMLLPRAFYDEFPLSGWGWVSALGPYDEHLVRDYGAMNLALCFLLSAAAVYFERRLARVALVTLLVFAVPHFAFHLTQTHHFSTLQNLVQLGGLGLQIVLPLALLTLTAVRGTAIDVGHTEGNDRVLGQDREEGESQ